MRAAAKWAGISLILLGIAACVFGPRVEESRVAQSEKLAQQTSDFISAPWYALGIALSGVGVGLRWLAALPGGPGSGVAG